MRKLNSKFLTNFISEKGSDPVHKTYVAYTPLDSYICIAVAESYDNDTELNSAKLAVETVLTEFEKNPSMKKIKSYIKSANEQILLHSTKNKLKVSITVIVSDYTRMWYGICGNTKIHIFYENMISHISETQTKSEQFEDIEGGGNLASAEIHNLTQYLGMGNNISPFISGKINLTEKSTILISTSNLWGLVSDIELLDAFENTEKNQEMLDNIEELLLSRQGSEKIGSYTGASIFIEKTFKEDIQKIKKRKKLLLLVAIIVACVCIIFLIVILSMRAVDRNKMSKIETFAQKGDKYIRYENYSKSLEQYEKADEISQKLSLNNWQYKNKKREIKELITDKVTLLTTLQDGEICINEKNYKEAKNLFTEVKKQAKYIEETATYDYAQEKLNEIQIQLDIEQRIALGDMYESTEDHENALEQYKEALEILKKTNDVETRGIVQTKIYDIIQLQKEAKKAKAEEEEKQKEEQAKADDVRLQEQIIRVQVLLSTGNEYLGVGKIGESKKVYKKILSAYNSISNPTEDVIKLYADIVKLEQAISEAEAKKAEEERNQKLEKAQEYLLGAAEAIQKGKEEEALELNEKALAIYKKLKIWDEQVEKVYDDIKNLKEIIDEEAVNKEIVNKEIVNKETDK